MIAPQPERCDCGAAIYWATTEAGHPMPVDAEPHPDGTAILRYRRTDRGWRISVRIVALGKPLAPGEKRRRTHWATCKDAAKHRRGGR